MKHFLAIVLLGLVIVSLADTKKNKKWKKGHGHHKHSRPMPAIPCEVDGSMEGFNPCPGESTCTSDPVTLTNENNTLFAVKVCKLADKDAPELARSLKKLACKEADSSEKGECHIDGEVCSNDTFSFEQDQETVSVSFCVESGKQFNLVEFLANTSVQKPHGPRDSHSDENEDDDDEKNETTPKIIKATTTTTARPLP